MVWQDLRNPLESRFLLLTPAPSTTYGAGLPPHGLPWGGLPPPYHSHNPRCRMGLRGIRARGRRRAHLRRLPYPPTHHRPADPWPTDPPTHRPPTHGRGRAAGRVPAPSPLGVGQPRCTIRCGVHDSGRRCTSSCTRCTHAGTRCPRASRRAASGKIQRVLRIRELQEVLKVLRLPTDTPRLSLAPSPSTSPRGRVIVVLLVFLVFRADCNRLRRNRLQQIRNFCGHGGHGAIEVGVDKEDT